MLKSSSIFDFSSIGARLIATALAAAITDLGMDSAFDVRVPRTRIEVDEAREAGAVVLVPDKTHVHTGGMRMSHRTLSLLHLRAFAVREIEELVKHPGLQFPRRRTVAKAWAIKTHDEAVILLYANRVSDSYVLTHIESSVELSDGGPSEVRRHLDRWEIELQETPKRRKVA